jgi:uncharacterized protein (TIGR02145 family)
MNDTVYSKCGKTYYNEITEFCYDNTIQKKCNEVTYDLAKQKCIDDTLLNLCQGTLYDSYSQLCVAGSIIGKEIFTDSRDGKEYKTVVIGKQIWMAENLNYNGDNNGIGRLYDWETAMTVCPAGWHLPSIEEWAKLIDEVGGNAGVKLKSTGGWRCRGDIMVLFSPTEEWVQEWGDLGSTIYYQGSCESSGDGLDEFGFSALPGGAISAKGSFRYAEEYGFWWSSTDNVSGVAEYLSLWHASDYIGSRKAGKQHQLSVRCIKD